MGDQEGSLAAYENAVRHNPKSIEALLRVASLARSREDLVKVRSHALALIIISKISAVTLHRL